MEVCFPWLYMRLVRLATRTRPFQVNRNDQRIAITSSSFFLNAHPCRVVCVGRHGRSVPDSFTMLSDHKPRSHVHTKLSTSAPSTG